MSRRGKSEMHQPCRNRAIIWPGRVYYRGQWRKPESKLGQEAIAKGIPLGVGEISPMTAWAMRTRSDKNDLGPRDHHRSATDVVAKQRPAIEALGGVGDVEFKHADVDYREKAQALGIEYLRQVTGQPPRPIMLEAPDPEFAEAAAAIGVTVTTA